MNLFDWLFTSKYERGLEEIVERYRKINKKNEESMDDMSDFIRELSAENSQLRQDNYKLKNELKSIKGNVL